jgi:spore maturation protein SpmA
MLAGMPHLPSAGILLKHDVMLNYVWCFLLVTGIIAGTLFGRLEAMMNKMFETCQSVVMDMALPLAGIMMLWLGILRVMEKCGLMEIVARMLSPILGWIFPDVPRNHPAMGAITMNIASNMLGLGNSSTPLGLKAMQHLQELNPHKQTASNAMCMFLAINTAGLAIIPMGSIQYLSAGGVSNPHEIIAPAFIATFISTLAGVVSAKMLQGLPAYRVVPDTAPSEDLPEGEVSKVSESSFLMTPLRKVLVGIAVAGFALACLFQYAPEKLISQEARKELLNKVGIQKMLDEAAAKSKVATERKEELKKVSTPAENKNELPWWRKALSAISVLAIPSVLMIVVLWALARGVSVYEEMVEGAKEGFGVALRIMPFLVVMLVGLSLFRESGALTLLQYMLSPVLSMIGMPVELFPLAVMRPLSGSGSAALLNEVILNPASTDFLKYTAAVLYGSTETTFYVIAVYFGCVSIRRTRHAIAAGLIADVAGLGAGLALGWLLFANA